MVEKIAIEIGLEGGDDVRDTLKSIVEDIDGVKSTAEELGNADATVQVKTEGADEAKASIDSVKSAAEDLGQTDATVKVGVEGADDAKASLQGMNQDLGETKGLLDPLSQSATIASGAIDSLGLAATKMGARMTRSLGVFGVLARGLGPIGIALGVVGGAFIKFGDDAAKALGGLTTEAAKLGLTAQQFDRTQKAMQKLGIGADAITSSLEQLKGLVTGGLFRLGDLVPPEATVGIQQFIAQLEKMPDGIARTKLAMDTLGEALGGQVIAGLQTGSISAEKFAAAMGSVTPATQEQIVQAAKYQQAINGLTNAWTQFKAQTATPLTPGLEFLTAQIPGIEAGIQTTVREFQALWSVINTVASAGASVIDALAAPINLVIDAVTRLGSALSGWNWNPIAAGVQVWNDIAGAIQGAIDKLLKFIGLKPSGPATDGGAPGKARGGLLGGRGTGTSDSNLAWLSRGEYIMPASAVRQPGVLAFLEALRRSGRIPGFAAGGVVAGGEAGSIIDSIVDTVNGIDGAMRSYSAGLDRLLKTFIDGLMNNFSALDQSMASIQELIIKQLEVLNRVTGSTRLIEKNEKNARGGLLGGRGTGTSDSNLAWVSRGEYITPARAVRQPGVLEFLELLRRSGGNLSRVLDSMGRFALGGMVPRAIPAFATGGLAGGMSNVTIQFPGLPAIGGLRASSDVVDQLHKAAALAQVRSGGRKPSRYS